jgi:hypothetical protein
MQTILKSVKKIEYNAKKITHSETTAKVTELVTLVTSASNETLYTVYKDQLTTMVESISKAHADYKLVMPAIVSYTELVVIKKKLTVVEFDAKKITTQ